MESIEERIAGLRPALVTASLSRRAGGMFYSARIPANRMHRAYGVDISVYGLADEDWQAAMPDWHVSRLAAYPPAGPASFRVARAMPRDLIAAKPDLIHLRGLWSYASHAVARARAATGVPTIISPEGMLDPWAVNRSRMKKRVALALFEQSNLERASVLHALNHNEARDIRAFGLSSPIAIIPNGVDLPGSAPANAHCIDKDGRRTMLFLARIHPKKGLAELIDAWGAAITLAPRLRDTWKLVIAGWDDGNHLSGLVARVAEHKLGDVISFPGPLFGEAKAQALWQASAFVLPSFGEGLPLGVLEAWAHELPVFMTDACNLPEGFAERAAIRITPAADMAAVLAEHLLGPATALAEMGRRGRALAEARFAWDMVVEQYLDLYAWVARGGQRPDFVRLD